MDSTNSFQEGSAAFHDGLAFFDNPYCSPGTSQLDYISWQRGWCAAYQFTEMLNRIPAVEEGDKNA